MSQGRLPTVRESIITLFLVAGTIVLCLRLGSGIEGVFFPLTLAVGIIGSLSFYLRQPWKEFQEGVFAGVGKVGIAALILLLIGALVGVWIQCGTIPTLIFYGLKIISPAFFLPTTFLVCLIVSLVTGTAYGTIGTVGIALIGVQAGFGYNASITAGAVISGAYFGDKMSPLSDTTNIAAAIGEADLFLHIRSMMYTTIPAAVVTFLLFWFAGNSSGVDDGDQFNNMLSGIDSGWNVGWYNLVPVIVMLSMAIKKVPTLPLIFSNVLFGLLWAVVFQDVSVSQAFGAATTGFESQTGVQSVDQVLSRGGITSMESVITLIILAGALGGALDATGVLKVIVESLIGRIKRTGSLIASVLASCYTVILFTGNQVLSLILAGQMFLPAFKKRKIDTTVLTRSLEDSGTLSAPLVPWGVAGGFCSSMLDVPVLDYLPYVWFAFTVPIFSIILGYTGIAVWKVED
ncbi:Na+/H+ antiporter NhaC [candidate division KSB1 bacterium]